MELIPASIYTLMMFGVIILAKVIAPKIGIYAIPISFGIGLSIEVVILAIIFPFVLRKKELIKSKIK